jgi:hypothetical protein
MMAGKANREQTFLAYLDEYFFVRRSFIGGGRKSIEI